jgi:tetratricopeptide (TPR) repeat protein
MTESSNASGGAPAGVWGVPYERNPHFTGRAKPLSELRDVLLHGKDARRSVQVIAGLGGIGKTQLALEFCYKHRWDYGLIWWINAEEPTSAALGYAKLAKALGLNFPVETSLDEIRHVLRRVLGQRNDWLLVFDNAAWPETVRNYFPIGLSGHVIVTTRNADWGDVASVTMLGRMTRNESIAFLRERTGRKDSNEVASRLAQALGDLPLALEQAAAVINENRLSFQEYLGRFETHWAELLQRGGGNYPDSVAMTWELSFRAVEEESQAAAHLMYFISCFGSDPVRRGFLRQSYAAVSDALREALESDESLDDALRALTRYSLIEKHDDTVTMHRLVASLTRNRLSDPERHAWLDMALRRICDVFDFQSQDVSTWALCAELVGKAMAVARFADTDGVAPLRVAGLLDHAGRYLLKTAQFEPARHALTRAMAIYESVCGDSHPKVAAVANNLGRVLTRLGENDQARWCFERALEIDRATYGEEDPHVATVANNYGMALHACGKVAQAKEQFRFTLEVYDAHYGPEHPKIAAALNNLGFVSVQLGEVDEAVKYFQRALNAAEASHHPAHPLIGSILSNLGDARRRKGDYERGRDNLVRALEIDEAAYGPVHPDISRDLQRLGQLMQATGDHEGAKACFQRALAIDEQVYGPEHVLLLHRLNPLAQLLRATGEFEESQRYFERATKIARDSHRTPAATVASGTE